MAIRLLSWYSFKRRLFTFLENIINLSSQYNWYVLFLSIHCVSYVYIKSVLRTTIAILQRFISNGCALISSVKTINAAITFETTSHLYELHYFYVTLSYMTKHKYIVLGLKLKGRPVTSKDTHSGMNNLFP